MRFRCDDALGNLGPWVQVIVVEVAELEAGDEQTAQAAVEVGFFDITPLDGCRQIPVFRATLYIRACQYGLC